MDLSQLSTDDLRAFQGGDISKVSSAGLKALVQSAASKLPESPDPTAGGSTLNLAGFDTGIKTSQGMDRFLSGAGKAVSDMGNGVRQIGAMVGIGDSAKVQADIDETKKLDKPLMDTGSGMAGNIAGNVAAAVLPAGALARGAQGVGALRTANAARAFVNPTTYMGAAGAGASLGALQPVASDESRAVNAGLGAVGGTLGQGVVNGLGRIAQPVQNALDPIRQKAIDTLRSAGVPLDLAQMTGSPTWGRIRSALGDNLFTMSGQAKKDAQQKDAFTAAALSTIGATGRATSDVMGDADKRIGDVFKDVLGRNEVDASPAWMTPLADAQAKAIEGGHSNVSGAITRVFDGIDPETGKITGQAAYNIKKDLDRYASSADTNQNYVARLARSALMDGVNSSLSGADQQAFSQARGQFANMKKLEGAIATDGSGDISAAKMANILGQKSNRSASLYGNGPQELVNLAQSGKMVLGDKTGNSGTAARVAAALLPGMATAAGAQLATGDPMEAAKYGLGVMGLPKAAQFMLNNPRMVGLLSDGVSSATLRGLLNMPARNVIAGQSVRALPPAVTRGLLLAAPE